MRIAHPSAASIAPTDFARCALPVQARQRRDRRSRFYDRLTFCLAIYIFPPQEEGPIFNTSKYS
jgi:D-alanyl-lipoteichoic acid acyltransferase DltB (MBOAT superfamily)